MQSAVAQSVFLLIQTVLKKSLMHGPCQSVSRSASVCVPLSDQNPGHATVPRVSPLIAKPVTSKTKAKLRHFQKRCMTTFIQSCTGLIIPVIEITSSAGGRHNMLRPCKLTFDLLTLKVVSESRVT